MSEAIFRQFLGKALDAKRGGHDAWAVQSTGEKIAVALALNRTDWLAEMGCTLADAIDRAGAAWVAMVPAIAKAIRYEDWAPQEREREVDVCTQSLRNVLALPDGPAKDTAIQAGRRELLALVGGDHEAYAQAIARAEGAAAIIRAQIQRGQ